MDFLSRSCSILQIVLIAGIVAILAVGVQSVSSLAVDGKFLVEETMALHFEAAGHGGVQFELLHWSHPQSPVHVPGIPFAEKFKYALQGNKERVAGLSRRNSTKPRPSNGSFVTPVHNLVFEYGMEITIGSPPRTFTAIADTGSDLVWVPCSPCLNCTGFEEPLFNPLKSSTYKKVSCTDPLCVPVEAACSNATCQYAYGYADGSETIGDVSRETITLKTTTGRAKKAKDFVFGCGHKEIGFNTGLVGLGKGPVSFTSQLGGLYGNKFAYCLVSFYDSSNKTSPLLFGNSSIPKGAVQYTPMITNPNKTFYGYPTFYYIGLQGLNVDEESLNIPSHAFNFTKSGDGGTIIDSGTSVTSLVDVAYNPLISKMKSLIKYPVIPLSNVTFGLDLCYDLSNMSSPNLAQFPNVTMVFDGMSLDLPQDNVFLFVSNTTACMAFGSSGPAPGLNIFGNVQQQNFQVLYDREASQFGFAQVQCDKLTSG